MKILKDEAKPTKIYVFRCCGCKSVIQAEEEEGIFYIEDANGSNSVIFTCPVCKAKNTVY